MKLSVIVCTRNRAQALGGCLDSIAQAFAAAAPIETEIVVVDNASEDNTPAIVRAWAEGRPFPVRILHEPHRGLAVARNRGMRAAQGELLAFTDDDCRLHADYVKDLLRHDANDTGPVLRSGRVEPGNADDLPLTIRTDRTLRRWNRTIRSARHENIGNYVLGCNMVMRRSVAEKLGPFDERFGAGAEIPGGDDIDYVFRAYLAGMTIELVPDMAVFHFHGRKSVTEGKKLLRDYTTGGGALYAKYLLKELDLCRQFGWDIKNAVREAFAGKNTFMPDIGFSHKSKVAYSALGAIKYGRLALRKRA